MGAGCPCCDIEEDKERKEQLRFRNGFSSKKEKKERKEQLSSRNDFSSKNEKDKDKDSDNTNFSFVNDKNSGNSNITEKKKLDQVKNDKAKNTQNIEYEELDFPPGEHYYQLIKDFNKSELIKKGDNLSENVELFFSLIQAKNPNDNHSFDISIINNTRIGVETYLGKLENRKGKEIEFGRSFQVDFFFEREQKIIIVPIINNKKIEGQKKEFVLCKLMTTLDNKLSIKIEDIGTLEINYKRKEKQNNELNDETSIFQFSIILNNEIFNSEESLKGIYFVIRNVKDGKKKRPVYKSHEYDFKLNEKKKSSFISLDSNILCNNDDSPIFFELYAPKINQVKFIGYCSFDIKKLKSNMENDKFEQKEIRSKDSGKLFFKNFAIKPIY